jgi:diaminohydroxyphosphoribosylaminopyrimidine deaminase/5-amino-6-(5-phosphoribosylamino)uracil reductase
MRLFSDVSSSIDDPCLREAYRLAERGRGATAPNPLVGCVIARPSGEVVGRGFHPRAGQPHAEIFALAEAGASAAGATAYVTLEPCSHHGRTPPCVDALVAAGVAHVVVGMRDPSPEAAGGAERLAAAGIEVDFAEDPGAFREQNRGWLTRVATGLPFVRAKVGVSLDARPAFTTGARAAMTGDSGAAVTARLRAASDAVLVSAATVAADDPALTVRDERGVPTEHQPLRVALVREQLPPSDAQLLRDGLAPTIVLVPDALETASRDALGPSVAIETYGAASGLRGALEVLGRRGVNDLLVEPGPRLLSALWDEGAVDELVTVVAGGMAGDTSPALFGGAPDRAEGRLVPAMTPVEAGIVGEVAVTVWRRRSPGVTP